MPEVQPEVDSTDVRDDSRPASQGRRVLMLCYFFPPIMASGTTRSWTFAERLPEFGWKPLVLTVDTPRDPWVKTGGTTPDDIEIRRTPEWGVAWLADFLHGACSKVARFFGKDLKTNFIREILCLPDAQVSWFTTAPGIWLARGSEVVYASCSPYSSAVSAAIIGLVTGKPVVLDLRDAWSLNPHWHHSPFHSSVVRYLERFVCSRSRFVIVNTDGAGALYRAEFPQWHDKFVVIPNGYDSLTPVEQSTTTDERFTILHLGSFYGTRSPDALLEVLAELQHLPIDFVQIGGGFESEAKFKGRVRMEVLPPVPREEALKMLPRASLLYLKQGWESGVTHDIAVAAKTYEYLATGLPILAELPPGDNANVVAEYGTRSYMVTTTELAALREAVLHAYERRNEPSAGISPRFIERFSRARLTEELSKVFDRAVSTTS